jgi:hypothetical protein
MYSKSGTCLPATTSPSGWRDRRETGECHKVLGDGQFGSPHRQRSPTPSSCSSSSAKNAVMGWGDDQIAAFLGIKSPTLTTLVNWGPPAMAAAGVLMAYHFMVYNRHHPSPPRFQDRAKEIDLTEALWFPKNPLGDAGKKPNMQVAWRRYPRASDYENRPT